MLLLSLVFLFISNLTKWLRLHQFLGTKTTEEITNEKKDQALVTLWSLQKLSVNRIMALQPMIMRKKIARVRICKKLTVIKICKKITCMKIKF